MLLQFTLESMKRRVAYIHRNFLQNETADSKLTHPVYLTPAEREQYSCIDNKCVKDLTEDITQSLDKIDESVYQAYRTIFNEVRGDCKQDLVSCKGHL